MPDPLADDDSRENAVAPASASQSANLSARISRIHINKLRNFHSFAVPYGSIPNCAQFAQLWHFGDGLQRQGALRCINQC
jgi:hypothetical protein